MLLSLIYFRACFQTVRRVFLLPKLEIITTSHYGSNRKNYTFARHANVPLEQTKTMNFPRRRINK